MDWGGHPEGGTRGGAAASPGTISKMITEWISEAPRADPAQIQTGHKPLKQGILSGNEQKRTL